MILDALKVVPRSECVLTGSKDLELLYSFKNFPIYAGCVDLSDNTEDLFCDMNWGYSKSSGNVQLLNLIDPSILYRHYQNAGTVGKTWKKHHRKFYEFISKHDYQNILEIGGGTGNLLHHFLSCNKKFNYTSVDPTANQDLKDFRVTYVSNFFEDFFTDQKYDTIVHSHVFEHIYNPINFLNKINSMLVDNGNHFLTLPNMKYWAEQGFANTFYFEHTFFVDDRILEYLLNETGFEVVEKIIETHSIFIHCKKIKNTVSIDNIYFDYPKILYTNYINDLLDDYTSIVNQIKNSNFYLFGAHIQSQVLLNLGLQESQIINILDNDPTKQNKRLYGTNLVVKSPECLKGLESPIVLIRLSSYTNEVKEGLLSINPSTKFI